MAQKIVKDFSYLKYKKPQRPDDSRSFHINREDKDVIYQSDILDDEEEFLCNMHNYGDSDDLPDSDRAMILPSEKCRRP